MTTNAVLLPNKPIADWLRECEGREWCAVYTETVLQHIQSVERTAIALGRLNTAERLATVAREMGQER